MADAPSYEALSYCWGEPTDIESIYCNGREKSVGRNLETALRHLRRTDETRILWADAICINQENLPEKSYQVSIMSLIYRDAKRVVVWLGEATDTTEQAISLLNKLSDASERFSDFLQPSTRSRMAWYWPELKEFLGIPVDWIEHFKPGPIMALNELMKRRWFGRAWIVQEVTSAKDIDILCGEHQIQWRKLYYGLRFAKKCGIADDTHERPAAVCWSPFLLRLE
jgi:hypothetical protein